jgi:mRNA interferase MazF
MISQGEVWWADIAEPRGSVAGFRRPVVVVQGDRVNQSKLSTIICVPMTGKMEWSTAPTSLSLPASSTGLDRDSVALTTKILAVDKSDFMECVGRISERQLQALFAKLDIALGR